MNQPVTPVRVFISSPGDLFPERDIVKQVVEELNRSPRYISRYKLIPYAYEDSTPALVGTEPQAVVDEYLLRPEAADIFVGMLWLRMGTPTKALVNPETGAPYQSGTEYELLTAYHAGQVRGWPKILLYRCTRSPDDIDKIDLEQYARVKRLFARFRDGGDLRGLVGEFRTATELGQTLRRDLEQLLERDLPAREASTLEQAPATGPVFFVPSSLPSGYVERTEALDTLRKALLGSRETVGVVAAAALHGLGGLGKTVVARAICDDPAVRGAFPDGVLWATLGQSAEPARHQRDWIGALGGDVTAASSLESGKVELGRLLAQRAVLLVLDDVWNATDAEWLRAGGPRCGVLITTRDATQAEGAALVELELMRRSESRALLRAAGARQIDDTQADAIAERVGHLPLALKIVGALLVSRIPWSDIAEALDEGDLAFLEHGQSSVLAAIAASVDRLPADDAARYRGLVIFPEDEPLVEAAVARLWAQTASLKPRQSRKLLADLRGRALVQADNTLHDLQYDYLRAQVPPAERRQLHSALADALSDPATGAPPPDDIYGWRRLAYHLARAERNNDLRDLLHNGAYLQGKIARLGTAALLEDFKLLPRDEESERMAGALRLGAHILDEEPRELENQLFGRLGSLPELHDVPDDGKPRFRLESQTLTAPGGPLVRILAGHIDSVASCAFSRDGKMALSASADRTLRLWDVATGRTAHVLEGHTSWVSGCAFSPDSRLCLSASGDKTLRLWDVAAGQMLQVLEGHSDAVNSCVFSPDGLRAASASFDRTLRLWDLTTGQTLQVLEGHTDDVANCAFSPDGELVLSASDDRTLRLWNLTNGQTIRVLSGHTDVVRGCAFSPDGKLALSASGDKTLRLWDVATGETVRVLKGHVLGVAGCTFSADGKLALSASIDEDMRLWDVTTGQSLRKLEVHSRHVTSCAFSPDGRYVLSASRDGTLRLSDLSINDLPVHTLNGHRSNVTSCAFSPDGQYALSASYDRTSRVWDVATGKSLRVLKGHTGWVNGCAFSPDGRLALSASADQTLRLWDVATGQSLRVLNGHAGWVNSCAFSPDGRLALSASADQTLRLWDVATGQSLRVLHGHTSYVNSCAFSPDGRLALSASADQTLRLWDIARGETLYILDGHTSIVHSCAFSPDGKLGASVSRDETLRLWDLASGQTVRVLEGHTDRVYGCAFSPGGKLVLSASWDRTLRLWDVATGAEIARWSADLYLLCCGFHPGDRRLISGGYYGNLHWLRIEGI